MTEFICDNNPIPASRKRVVAIAFGDVDRVSLSNGEMFTGSAVLVTVYSVTARYQYYVVLFSLSNKVVEIWHAQPKEVALSDSPKFEDELCRTLHSRGITLNCVQADSSNFNVLLTRLPMAFNDENETAPAGNFTAPGNNIVGNAANIEEERKKLADLFVHF